MHLNEYQKLAMRTKGDVISLEHGLIAGALGISGEAGEVTDYIKKVVIHQHPLDSVKLSKEIGDVLWYAALLADMIGVDLATIAKDNIEKLKVRYPEGFSPQASIQRVDEVVDPRD